MAGFLGMRGTGDWVTDQRPKNWRQTLLFLYPNGMMPLTGMMSKLPSEGVDDPEFNWWTKGLAAQAGAITNIYLEPTLTNPYSTGGKEHEVVYVKTTLAVNKEFRVGHQVLLRDASNYGVDVNAKVTAVVQNGVDSYIACRLLEDDDNGGSDDLSDADRILVIGNINPEGGYMPDALSYEPTKFNNYCTIARTPLSITRTARKTRLRTPAQYKESKREALELHGIEMEKQLIWSIPTEFIGENNKPERTTGGIVHYIKTFASSNIDDFRTNTDFSGNTWLQGGEEWFDERLELVYRYGSTAKVALCGSKAMLGIQRLVKNSGQFQLKSRQKDYGISVTTWIHAFGTLELKTHPLFSFEVTNQNDMLIVDLPNLRFRYVDDTFFKKDDSERRNTSGVGKDATDEEYLTEWGLEMHHAETMGFLHGVGQDNTV